MHAILTDLLIYIIPALFASQGLWTYLLYKQQKKDSINDLRTRADLVILHDLLYKYCIEAIKLGYTTFDEFDNVTEIYTIYTEIGGNGTGKRLYEEFCTLPKR